MRSATVSRRSAGRRRSRDRDLAPNFFELLLFLGDNALRFDLVVDNYGTHKHPKVKAWLAQRPRWQVHFTPTYTS
jgi:hypothetical protein